MQVFAVSSWASIAMVLVFLSSVDLRHELLVVTGPGDLLWRERGVELRDFRRGEVESGRAHVLFEIAPPLRARDRDDVLPFVQQPRERDLRGRRAPARRELPDRRRGANSRVEILAGEPRIAAPEVALGILLRPPGVAGEETATERGERDEADAELAQQRKDPRLEVPLPQRVLALKSRDRVNRVRAADRPLTRLREAEKAHLPFAHELRHRADDVLDRNVLVDAVLVEQVDGIGSEPPERPFHRVADMLGPAVETRGFSVDDPEPELRCDHDFPPAAGDRAPDQVLVGEGTVHLGRVEERDPEIERAVDRGDRLGLVGLAVGLAHAHAAQAERRNLEALPAEPALRERHAGIVCQSRRRSAPSGDSRAGPPQGVESDHLFVLATLARARLTPAPRTMEACAGAVAPEL